MEVSELKGFKSLRALNVFHTLLLGLKMLPSYMGEQYEDFYERFSEMDATAQETLIREAALFVELQKEEVEALLSFCKDKNGVPYNASNIGSLGPDDLVEAIVSVCMEIGKIKISLVNKDEKKN